VVRVEEVESLAELLQLLIRDKLEAGGLQGLGSGALEGTPEGAAALVNL